jgi:antitoxin MazE
MKTVVAKWGNSLGIRLPKTLARHIGISSGTLIRISADQDKIIISPDKYDLKEMLKKIKPENNHKETLPFKKAGKEIW